MKTLSKEERRGINQQQQKGLQVKRKEPPINQRKAKDLSNEEEEEEEYNYCEEQEVEEERLI